MRSLIGHKPLQFFSFFFMTVMILGTAHAQAPACFDIFNAYSAQPTPINSLVPPDLKIYRDFYGRGDNEIYFWNHHKRYGVYRNSKDRLILTAKNKTDADQLLADIGAYTGLPLSLAQPVKGPGWLWRWSTSYDVTDMLPDILRDRLEIAGSRRGQNCFNACLVVAGYSRHVLHTSLRELMLWLKSPLATPITDVHDLRPGDILTIRGKTDGGFNVILHTAIYVSPRLVISKNGVGKDQAWRLMDIEEMFGLYMVVTKDDLQRYGPTYSPKLGAYRLKDVDAYLANKNIELPETFKQAEAEIEQLEAHTEAMFAGQYDKNTLDSEFRSTQKRWHEVIRQEKQSVENTIINPDLQDVLLTLWESLNLRIDSVKREIESKRNRDNFE